MFATSNLQTTITGLSVKVRIANDEHVHVVRAGLRLPLTYELARELSETVARDLYTRITRDGTPVMVPKPEMHQVRLTILTSVYELQLRYHPEIEPGTRDRIPHVRISGIWAEKENPEEWTLKFQVVFEEDDQDFRHLVRLVQSLKMAVFATFVDEEPGLPMDEPAAEAPGTGLMRHGGAVPPPPTDVDEGEIIEGHLLTDGERLPDLPAPADPPPPDSF